MLLGDERHRRAGHHVGDGAQLIGCRLGRGDESGDRLGRRGQDEDPADDAIELVQAELEPRHDAEVRAGATDRPEKIGLVLGIDRRS